MRHTLHLAMFGLSFAVCLPAAPQQLPVAVVQDVRQPRGEPVQVVVQLPAGHDATRWCALLVLFADGARDLAAAKSIVHEVGEEVARAGFVVASVATSDVAAHAKVFEHLRLQLRIEQGAMHAGARGDSASFAAQVVLQHRHEFQTLTVWGGATAASVAAVGKLHGRRVCVVEQAEASALRQHFVQLHAQRTQPGLVGDVDRTLDAFHDAASKGDETVYFQILPDDAVFLGTDATERWTGAEFRSFALPYFQRASAWIYVPMQRSVTVEADGRLAWFDEVLDNAGYGECRGSGVLVKRDERWVLQQYNLTVPVPNDLMRGVAQRIRNFSDGVSGAATTVILVRHAEKADDSADPELSAAGRARAAALAHVLKDVPLQAVFTSQYRRTGETVAAVCREQTLVATVVPAADVRGLAAKLRQAHAGQTVLVCGHSNTVPTIAKALGVVAPITLDEADYDRIFVVVLDADGARLLPLRY